MGIKRLFIVFTLSLLLTLFWTLGLLFIARAAGPDPDLNAQPNPPAAAFEEPDAAVVRSILFQLPLQFIPNHGQSAPVVRFYVHGLFGSLFLTPEAVVFALPTSEGKPEQEHADGEAAVNRRTEPQSLMRYLDSPADFTHLQTIVRLTFDQANPTPTIEGLTSLPGVVNLFVGHDSAQWQSNLPTYEAVVYRDLYLGIDLVYRGTDGHLKSEFIVAPGADPSLIRLRYQGVDSLYLRSDGTLVLQTSAGELVETPPFIYQEINGSRREIAGHYILLNENGQPLQASGRIEEPDLSFGHLSSQAQPNGQLPLVAFQLDPYDPSHPLIIDPELAYSSYLAGNNQDSGWDIAVDDAGNIYVAGETNSSTFPTQKAAQGYQGGLDAFVTQLIKVGGVYTYGYSTYLGGSGYDFGYRLAVDSAGNVYITAVTGSTDFPTRNPIHGYQGNGDVFVSQIISASGVYTLGYSTYLGGSGYDQGAGIAVDSAGNIYLAGVTASTDFPTWKAIQGDQSGDDVFVTQLISTSGIYTYGYSTYLGGSGIDSGQNIIVDSAGNVYVTGETSSTNFPTWKAIQGYQGGLDAFVTQLIKAGGVYTYGYSTYLGGGDTDGGHRLAVDSAGNVYIAGQTFSNNFPTRKASQSYQGGGDAFVTQIVSASGVYTLGYSTYLGGSGPDFGGGIAVGQAGHIYVTGRTASADFPTRNAIQGDQGGEDVFVTQLISTSGIYTYGYSTYLGGSGDEGSNDLALDSAGHAYVTGGTSSTNFPLKNAIQSYQGSTDAFVVKLTSTPCFARVDSTSATFSSSNAQAVQLAVDAASTGDLIKLAGSCAGVEARAGLSQTVYISKPLTLRGGYTITDWFNAYPLTQPTTLDAQGLGRVVVVPTGAVVTMTNLTITNGNAPDALVFSSEGGGIWNAGTLTLQHVTLISNSARGPVGAVLSISVDGLGGGIYNKGTLILQHTTLMSNSAYGGNSMGVGPAVGNGRGGGIWNGGSLTLQDSTLISNTAVGGIKMSQAGPGQGGAIFNASPGGVMTVSNSVISSNLASTHGGGIYSSGVLTVNQSTLISNTVLPGNNGPFPEGGGFFNTGTLTMTRSTIKGNRVESTILSRGGGFKNEGGTVTLNNSAVISNSTVTTIVGGPIAMPEGGGIYNLNGTVTLNNSTISRNSANGSPGVIASGGGIFNNQGTVTLNSSTVTSNTVFSAGGGIYNLDPGSSMVHLKNSIIAGNVSSAPFGSSNDCFNTDASRITSWGHNLIGNNSNCSFNPISGDQVGMGGISLNPKLGPLQDNGGSTLTHALLPGSPAIDAGACLLPTDQRDQPRPGAGSLFCDTGAFEVSGVTVDVVMTKAVTPATAKPGQLITYTLSFNNQGSGKAGGLVLTDIIPVTLTNLSVVSSNVALTQTNGGVLTYTWQVQDLAPGQKGLITLTGQISSPLAGPTLLTNTARLTTTAPESNTTNNEAKVSLAVLVPALSLLKSVTNDTPYPGERITYTLLIHNSGPVNATQAVVSDPLAAGLTLAGPVTVEGTQGITGAPPLLASGLTISAGQRITVTVPVTVQQDLLGGARITNVATLSSSELTGHISGTAVITIGHAPVLTVTKTANLSLAHVSDTITYTYRLTNSGNTTLTNISATDDPLGPISLEATLLAPDQSTTGFLTHTVVAADLPGPLTNTVTVTGTSPTGSVVSATAAAVVDLISSPALTVTKTANVSTAKIGDTITYTYRLINIGNTNLTNLSASDIPLGPLPLIWTTLTPGQSMTGSLTYTVVAADLPGPLTNTVTVTGTPPSSPALTARAVASVTLTFNPALSVTKTASLGTAEVGEAITYTYRITNSGDVPLTGLQASDDPLGAISLGQTTLAPGQVTSGTLTYSVVAADLPGPLTNTVTVAGLPPAGPAITATARATVSLISPEPGSVGRLYLPLVIKSN